ncbi:EAL domain-containing protein [Simplicispira psychrophila]|uniref:EAL domain-containing protein n=1 Tax=Simplicispira psychrophila TaxID=80882 RepID=UPI0004831081|nr:EAL domain-containing protein [Simplicispira psychrophila]
MLRDLVLVLGLLALLILAMATIPVHTILRNSLRLRVAIGLAAGLSATANMALPALQNMLGAIHTPPVSSAIAMLVFGPVAGLVSAATVLLFHFMLHPAGEILGIACMVTTSALAYGWHRIRSRSHPLVALAALSLTLPLVLHLCLQWWGSTPASDWLSPLTWRFGMGALLLGGGIELVMARARSVQALEQAHETLQRREQELLLALESAHGGRWGWDIENNVFTCSGHFYDAFGVLGYDSATLQERWNALRHPEDAARITPHLQRSALGLEEIFHAEYRMRDIHGHWRWLVSRGIVASRNAQGLTTRLTGLHLDVTASREIEEALRTAQTKYTAIYDTMPDAAGISSLTDGRFLEVNAAFCQLLGLTREEVIGRTAQEAGVWATEHERPKLVQALQRDGKVDRLAMLAQGKNRRIPGLMSARPVQIDGEACLVFVFRDITQETRTNTELVARNSLLQQAGRLARLGAWEDVRGQGIAYWSDVCYDIHGLTPDAPLPRNYISEHVAPAWQEAMREQARQCILQQTEWSAEIEIVRADGALTWVRVRGEPVVENGRVTRIRGVMLDIDQAKRTEQRLRQSEERFLRIFQLLPYPMGLTRRSDGSYIEVNTAWEQALGFSRAEALGQSSISLGIYTAAQRATLIATVPPDGQLNSYEAVMTVRSGEKRTVLQSMRAATLDGEACWLFAMHDITNRKRAEERVREREELLSLTISAASLGLWDWNLQTGMVTGDHRWHEMRGSRPDGIQPSTALSWTAAMGSTDIALITAEVARHGAHPETPFDATWRITHPHHGDRWIHNLGKIVSRDAHGQPLRMVGACIDVTTQREQEERLQKMAHYDALTGLPNRVLLAQQLEEAMANVQHSSKLLGVAYLDLDGFKPVNDRFGHDTGDQLLVMVATRLTRALRSCDCVARLGGDEFVILLPDLANVSDGEQALHTVMQRIAAPYTLGTERVTVTASIGYTLYPQDAADADTLLRHADQAMYAAKQAGRNRFHQFDAASERATQQTREQLVYLRTALANGQFVLFLQPKVDMRLGTVVGAEALARWQHPEKGILSPAAFLPLLENTDLEFSFGAWAVNAALDLIEALMDSGLYLPVSVNIAAPHLQQPQFAAWMAQQLARHPRVPATLLEIEITETAALYNIDPVADTLRELGTLGIKTSLDDFGTGYSSLTYLRRLPLSTLKIDQSFVQGMMNDTGDRAIVQGVVGLATSFGYDVIAEGVETIEQGQLLLQMGCPLAQGYCVARPMALAAFQEWAGQWQAPAAWRHQDGP